MTDERGILHLIPLLILLGGIIAGVYLVQKTQIFKPKASTQTIFWVGATQDEIDKKDNCVTTKENGEFVTKCPTVKFKLSPTLDSQPAKVSVAKTFSRLLSLPASGPVNRQPIGKVSVGKDLSFFWSSVQEAKRYRLIIVSNNGESNQYNDCHSNVDDFSGYFYCAEKNGGRLITQPGAYLSGSTFQDGGSYSWWVDALGDDGDDKVAPSSHDTSFTVNKLSPVVPDQGGQTQPAAPAQPAQPAVQALSCEDLSVAIKPNIQLVPMSQGEKKTVKPGDEITVYADGNRDLTDQERRGGKISWWVGDSNNNSSPNTPGFPPNGKIWYTKWIVPNKSGIYRVGTYVDGDWQSKCDVNFEVVGATGNSGNSGNVQKEKVSCSRLNAYSYEDGRVAGEISSQNQSLMPGETIQLSAAIDKGDRTNSIDWNVSPDVGGFSNQDWNKILWTAPNENGIYSISVIANGEPQADCEGIFRVTGATAAAPEGEGGRGRTSPPAPVFVCPADKITNVEYWQCGGTTGLEDKVVGTAYYIRRTDNECTGRTEFRIIPGKERANAADCPQPEAETPATPPSSTPPSPAEKPARVVTGYKFAESEKELDSKGYTPWESSTKEMVITYTFKEDDQNNKVIYAKFQYNDGEENAYPYPLQIKPEEKPREITPSQPTASEDCTGTPDASSKWVNCSPSDLMQKFSSTPGSLASLPTSVLEKFKNEDLLVIGRSSGGIPAFLSRFSAARLVGLSPFEGSGFGLDILKQLPQSKIYEFPIYVQDQIEGKSPSFPQSSQRVVDEQKCKIEGCGFCPATTDKCGNTVYSGSCNYSTCKSVDDTYTCTSSLNNSCQGTYRCGTSCIGL